MASVAAADTTASMSVIRRDQIAIKLEYNTIRANCMLRTQADDVIYGSWRDRRRGVDGTQRRPQQPSVTHTPAVPQPTQSNTYKNGNRTSPAPLLTATWPV